MGSRDHLRQLHTTPERTRRGSRPAGRGPPADHGLGAARRRQIDDCPAGRRATASWRYVDVRALLLDPVDLRGIFHRPMIWRVGI